MKKSLEKYLITLKSLLDNNKANEVKEFLFKILKSYKPIEEIADHIFIEQLSANKVKQNISLIKDKDDNVVNIR